MSKYRNHKHRNASVIAVDSNYLPMLEVSRRHAMIALATGRALALDVKTWATMGLKDVAGKAFNVIVYPKAKAIPTFRLGFGRGNMGILRRDEFVCQYEGCNHRATTVDHVIPRCQGGATSWSNLVGCCHACNASKGGRTPEQAQMRLKHPVRSPKWHLMEQFHQLCSA